MIKNDIKGIVFGCIVTAASLGLIYGTPILELGTAYGEVSTKIEALEKAEAKFVNKEVFEITVNNMAKDIKNIGEDIKIIKQDIKVIAENGEK